MNTLLHILTVVIIVAVAGIGIFPIYHLYFYVKDYNLKKKYQKEYETLLEKSTLKARRLYKPYSDSFPEIIDKKEFKDKHDLDIINLRTICRRISLSIIILNNTIDNEKFEKIQATHNYLSNLSEAIENFRDILYYDYYFFIGHKSLRKKRIHMGLLRDKVQELIDETIE